MCGVLLERRSLKYTGGQQLSGGAGCNVNGEQGVSHKGEMAPADDQPLSRPGGRVWNEVEEQGRGSGDVAKSGRARQGKNKA